MQFGVVAVSAFPPRRDLSSKDVFDYAMETCRVAQESGFDAVGISHRYLAGRDHAFLQPLVTAAHILAAFPGLYVTTNIFLLPYDNPVKIAEEVATLDLMAPGKFVFGVGQGYRQDELYAFDVRKEEGGRRVAESIKAMRLLWTGESVSFEGEFWHFKEVQLGVAPVNKYGPPIMIGADKLLSVSRVPQRGGDHWLPSSRHSTRFLREALPVYKAALEREGRTFEGIPLIRDIAVAGSKEAAESIMKDAFTDYLNRQSTWGQPGERYDLAFDELKQDRFILGTSEDAAEELVALHREFGAKFVTFRVYTPGMAREAALDVVRQIGTEVIPLVRKEVGKVPLFA